jgi:hypothetical protein
MQAPFLLGHSEHLPTLADELRCVATLAYTAATLADGEYLPQMPREHELQGAWRDASHACAALQQVAVRVAHLEAAEDGIRLVKAAIQRLDAGRSALRDGVVVVDDVVSGSAAVVDSIATGSAGAMLREAAQLIRGLADLAQLESMTPDEVFQGLLRRG